MKVAFYLADQNPHRDRTKGITVYTEGLLRALISRPDIEVSTLISQSSYSPTAPEIKSTSLPFPTDRTLGRLLADQMHPLFHRKGTDLWHYPKGYLPLGIRYRQPVLGTCHDVILQYYADHYPNLRSASQYRYWLTVLRRSLARFDAVFTVSEFSKAQIIQFCDRHRLRAPKIVVTVEGTEWGDTSKALAPKENFVLHLGSIEPHKGTSRLLDHWKLLEAADKECTELIVLGDVSGENQTKMAALRHARHLPAQSREALTDLVQKAMALILPSEIEGFGLPAIEAFASLTPVVFGKGTAVAEIIGPDSAGAFELTNFDSFNEALNAVLRLPPERIRDIRDRLARKYTWKACAEKTIRTYMEFFNSSTH
jgi:glycosyltransferase involved in cell wall biosynthesis